MQKLLPLYALVLAGTVSAQTTIPIPAFVRTFSSTTLTRGFHFQAPVPFIITGLQVPDEQLDGTQNVEVFVQTTPFPSSAGAATQRFVSINQPSNIVIQTGGIVVNQGDYVGILGACGTSTMQNSYGALGPFTSSIFGAPMTIDRFITQTNLNASGGGQSIFTDNGYDIGRVDVHIAPTTGVATATTFGAGCGGTDPQSFYEVFTGGNPMDLSNTTFQMFWTGSTYVTVGGGIGMTSPTNLVAFRDDETQQFPLPNPMPTSGGPTSSIWVCSNGWIAFQSTTSADLSESTGELLNEPYARIAPLWDDLNPAAGGAMYVDTIGNFVHVTWNQVPEYGTTNANTVQVSFDTMSGNIEVNYGAVAVADCMVGYSPGHGVADPGGVDISAATSGAGILLGTGVADFELLAGARPIIAGPPASCSLANIPAAAVSGAFLLGFTGFDPGLPLDIIGADGCELYSNGGLAAVPFAPTGPTQSFSLQIPTPVTGSFVGLHIYLQGIAVAPGINTFGLVTSNGLDWSLEMN